MLDCIIVDDEPIARNGLALLLKRYSEVNVLAAFPSAIEALNFLSKNKVDLDFLDIQMPGLTGLEMARQHGNDTLIIFVTAYDDYAVEGYDLDAVDYLLKPINPERLGRAVNRVGKLHALLSGTKLPDSSVAIETVKLKDGTLTIRADRGFARISLQEIVTIQGLKDYVIINLEEKKFISKITIKSILGQLPQDKFLRVNKSNIVNIDRITFFTGNDIVIGDDEIAIGPAYRERVMRTLL